MGKMMVCKVCENYTLAENSCPKCGGDLKSPHPPKFSLEDRYLDMKVYARKFFES